MSTRMGWVLHFDTALLVVILTRCVQRCVTGISLILPQGLQRGGCFVLFFFLLPSGWVFGRNDGRYTGGCFCLCAEEMQRALVRGTRCNVKGSKLAVIDNHIVHIMNSVLFLCARYSWPFPYNGDCNLHINMQYYLDPLHKACSLLLL